MNPERWQRIDALLDSALDLPVGDRAAFLASACGDDAELRTEVGALLAACENPALFPDGCAANFAAPLVDAAEDAARAPEPRVTERIGAYRIIRELGRGGMGAVYLAERDDGEFEHRVAIKLMRFGLGADPLHLRRFRKERQILARLEHPHIARLLDGGVTADGQPFFVMEYVDGQPIDRYCNDRHLPVDARLAVFLTACDAVAHAHRHGVVHRDLKPSNILVTADGELKLLDFGIARLIAAEAADEGGAALTRTGERLLTPEYASPEQIRGTPISETTDVYALGVLCYELLTGRRPYPRAGRTPHELEDAILTEEPTRPSTAISLEVTTAPEQIGLERRVSPEQLRRRLRGDLDAIVLQTLRKDPAHRYASAADLAADLRRHLEGLPIQARAESRAYRLRRFARRHRLNLSTAAVGAIAGMALLVALGLVTLRPGGAGRALDAALIVVAPFENRTGDATLDPLGVMAAEWITQALWRTGLVNVVDAQTALAAAIAAAADSAAAQPLRAIGEQTGAGTVVTGTYYLEGAQLRFQAQITEAGSGRLRQSMESVHAPRDSPAEALEPLRQRVTGALAVLVDDRLNNWSASTSRPPLYEAYQAFLLGMAAFGSDYATAIAHFARATELDATYWQAYLWQGQALANTRNYPAADSVFGLVLPHRAQLGPYDAANLDYYHRGYVRGDWQASYDGARRMVELAPAAPHALYALGSTATFLRRCEEALDALGRIDLERGWGKAWSTRVLRLMSRCLHDTGDHSRELSVAQRLREADPGMGWTRLAEMRALAALGRTAELMRRVEEAVGFPATTEAQTWEAFSPGSFLHEAARELAVHGRHHALAAQLRRRSLDWYRSRPAVEAATARHRRELAGVLYGAGDLDQARMLYAGIAGADPADMTATGWLALIAVRQRRQGEADSLVAALHADQRPYRFGRAALSLAHVAALEGDPGKTVELLRQAQREGFTGSSRLHVEQDFDSIRDDSAFRDLLRPIPMRAR